MAITLPAASCKAMCDALVDLVDGGTGAGNLIGYTSGDVEVFTCAFQTTAFGAATTATPSVATATSSINDDTSATGGNLSGGYHAVEDGDGTEIWRGSVSTSGADLNISSLTVGAGEVVSVSSYTVSVPAS